MPEFSEIVEQVALEREAIAQGLKKLRENTKQLEEKITHQHQYMELLRLIHYYH